MQAQFISLYVSDLPQFILLYRIEIDLIIEPEDTLNIDISQDYTLSEILQDTMNIQIN